MALASLPIILAMLLAAAGFCALWVGWHGKLVDKHPRCRRCLYDLTNRPEDQQRCPECGSWITATGAIRYGTYEKRPWLAWTGLLAMVVGLFSAVTSFLMVTRWVDLNEYLPTAWVVRDMWQDDRAGTQIIDRLTSGKLSPSQIAAIVDQILARQADPKVEWHQTWGEFVEKAQSSGLLDKPRWERYARQALPIEVRVRERVRKGDPIPLAVSFGEMRREASSLPGLIWSGTVEHRAIVPWSDDAMLNYSTGAYPRVRETGHGMEARIRTNTTAWATIAPGRETITVKGTITLAGSPLTTRYDKVVDLLPPDQPSSQPIDRPDLREVITKGITATVSENNSIIFQVRRAPVNLAFDAVLRSGQRESPLGQFTVPAGAEGQVAERKLPFKAPPPGPDRVTILLRPSPAAAAQTLDITDYWNGEIVLVLAPPQP